MIDAPSMLSLFQHHLRVHLVLFFQPTVLPTVIASVAYLGYEAAKALRRPVIAIPTDIPAPLVPDRPFTVPFNGTNVTVWNPLPKPEGEGWEALPNEATPLWYRHHSGTLLPAWNIFANVVDLLTFREDRAIAERDRHGRAQSSRSPRLAAGVYDVPAVNEAFAAIVAASQGMATGTVQHLNGIEPPKIVLSHDLDLLSGNDAWTQMIRLLRVPAGLLQGNVSSIANLRWFVENVTSPYRYYRDAVPAMVALEAEHGFRSTSYFLNGTGGRFGARSGPDQIPAAAAALPEGWEKGIHYNYDTFLDDAALHRQRQDLEALIGPISIGRAHYLRFDTQRSFKQLVREGIMFDESVGSSAHVGYRAGIAGVMQPVDVASGEPLPIWECPLTCMDIALANANDDPVLTFSQLIRHIGHIGGSISLLFHNDSFDNPEFPRLNGVYGRILQVARALGAESWTPSDVVRRLQAPVPAAVAA